MVNPIWSGVIIVAGAAVFYQRILLNLINIAGIGRSMQPLSDFPYSCRRIYHEKLESCEDLWLDNKHRQIYLACSGLEARTANNPDTGVFNETALPRGSGFISVLDIDKPGTDGLFGLRPLGKGDFKGYRGDGTFNPNGFGVEAIDEETLRFFITDLMPVLDPTTKKPVATVSTEKRSAIQVFTYRRGESDMRFEYELAGDVISLPNRVTVLKNGNIVLTNDHTHSSGIRRQLEVFTGGGNLVHCDTKVRHCKVIVAKGTALPNGLQVGPDGLVYVPNCYTGDVQAYEIFANSSAALKESFRQPYSLDNLAFDAAGDMWAPGISKVSSFKETVNNPYSTSWHSTIWRFHRGLGQRSWTAEKMVEDADREIVSGITTVEHDVQTGRLFMTGAYTPYIVVCDPPKM